MSEQEKKELKTMLDQIKQLDEDDKKIIKTALSTLILRQDVVDNEKKTDENKS